MKGISQKQDARRGDDFRIRPQADAFEPAIPHFDNSIPPLSQRFRAGGKIGDGFKEGGHKCIIAPNSISWNCPKLAA